MEISSNEFTKKEESSSSIPIFNLPDSNFADILVTDEPAKTILPNTKKRNKIALSPGHSHMDWMRLISSGKDLSGTGGKIQKITMSEVKKHNIENDAWMILRGKVYNVGPYLDFHPGGKNELMRAVGKDGTKLFEFKHSWVNAEALLSSCLVGFIVPE